MSQEYKKEQLYRILEPSMFIWPPGRKLKKKEKEELQVVERECAEKADKLVCYHVKGFKKKTVKVKVKVLPKWRNKLLKESNNLRHNKNNLLKVMRKDHRDQLEEALNHALRRDVLDNLFPAVSGLRKRAENSIGMFENNVGFTLLYYGGIQGSANVHFAVTQSGGGNILQSLWLSFLGEQVKNGKVLSACSAPKPCFDSGQKEADFRITDMNINNDRFCKVDMTRTAFDPAIAIALGVH
jgi:hypothetical protein